MTQQTLSISTVHNLRRRWKPHKERLLAAGGEQSTSIRFHRTCSWMDRVEKNANNADLDLDLISLWIAFNALYGQWDEQRQEPKPDRECWRGFVDRVLSLDKTGHLAETLTVHKRLVMSLLEDQYLSGFFPGTFRPAGWTIAEDKTQSTELVCRKAVDHGPRPPPGSRLPDALPARTWSRDPRRQAKPHLAPPLRNDDGAAVACLPDGLDQPWGWTRTGGQCVTHPYGRCASRRIRATIIPEYRTDLIGRCACLSDKSSI